MTTPRSSPEANERKAETTFSVGNFGTKPVPDKAERKTFKSPRDA
jgi:hypothetical protein